MIGGKLFFFKYMFLGLAKVEGSYSLGIQSLTEPENGFMESKYLAFRFGDCTPQSSSDVR